MTRSAREPSNWLQATEMGVGCWQWGDQMMWGYGQGYGDRDVQAAFLASVEAGLDFFDTAEVYGLGRSERFLGQFMRASQKPAWLATKFMPFPWRLSRPALLAALHQSLKRLGLPRVDLYQIHWPLPPRPVEVWADALADAAEAGLVGAVGVSNFNLDQTRRTYLALQKRGLRLASNQVHYSLLDRKVEQAGVLALCQELGVRLIAYSPLEKGVLSGKYTSGQTPRGLRSRTYNPAYLARVQPLIDLLREISGRHGGKTPAQVALNWLICKGALPIPGAKNEAQARQNAGAIGWRLTAAEVAALDEASARVAPEMPQA